MAVEFGNTAEREEMLDGMVKELASGDYNVVEGQQLLGPQGIEDPDSIMSFDRAPG